MMNNVTNDDILDVLDLRKKMKSFLDEIFEDNDSRVAIGALILTVVQVMAEQSNSYEEFVIKKMALLRYIEKAEERALKKQ